MSQELADVVRGKCSAVAVSDGYKLAPWADAMVSNDAAWWTAHPEALEFAGRKFCTAHVQGTERLRTSAPFMYGVNSGLQGMRVAELLGATLIALLGFDMRGSHYFGPHPAPLRNTSPDRFRIHIRQFDHWRGCRVVNCTPGSALTRFPFADINEILHP